MSELTVTTLSPDVLPPILFDELNDLANLHLRVAMECRLTLALSGRVPASATWHLMHHGPLERVVRAAPASSLVADDDA